MEYPYRKESEFYSVKEVDFSDLIGKKIVEVSGLKAQSTYVYFRTECGKEYGMVHHQDCCESVDVEDVDGSAEDLVNATVMDARVETRSLGDEGVEAREAYDSFTYTFYHIRTDRGYVVIRWYGSSNGYYSESVSFMLREQK